MVGKYYEKFEIYNVFIVMFMFDIGYQQKNKADEIQPSQITPTEEKEDNHSQDTTKKNSTTVGTN